MFEDNKKENRRKNFTSKKKKDSSKRRFNSLDDDVIPRSGKHIKSHKDNMKADEIWEEWQNREEE